MWLLVFVLDGTLAKWGKKGSPAAANMLAATGRVLWDRKAEWKSSSY